MFKTKSKEVFSVVQILEHYQKLELEKLINYGANRYKQWGSEAKDPHWSVRCNAIGQYCKTLTSSGKSQKNFLIKKVEIFKYNSGIITLSDDYFNFINGFEYEKFKRIYPLSEFAQKKQESNSSKRYKDNNNSKTFHQTNKEIEKEFENDNDNKPINPGEYRIAQVKVRRNHTKWANNLKKQTSNMCCLWIKE